MILATLLGVIHLAAPRMLPALRYERAAVMGGETWRLAEGSEGSPDLDGPPAPFVYPDVHSLEVHPSSPDLVFAPTGGGFYRSRDRGGRRWELLYACYCRAVWVDPVDPDHLILNAN